MMNIPIKKNGKPTWPEAYTIEEINKIEQSAEDFAGEYLGEPSAGADIFFDVLRQCSLSGILGMEETNVAATLTLTVSGALFFELLLLDRVVCACAWLGANHGVKVAAKVTRQVQPATTTTRLRASLVLFIIFPFLRMQFIFQSGSSQHMSRFWLVQALQSFA